MLFTLKLSVFSSPLAPTLSVFLRGTGPRGDHVIGTLNKFQVFICPGHRARMGSRIAGTSVIFFMAKLEKNHHDSCDLCLIFIGLGDLVS